MYIYEVYWNKINNYCAGWFTSEKKAEIAIKWLKEKVPDGDFFIRRRQLDVINGRYAYTVLGVEDPESDMIDDIRISFTESLK